MLHVHTHGHVSHFNAKMGEWSIKDTISLFASACPSIIKKELTTGMTDIIINDKPEPMPGNQQKSSYSSFHLNPYHL